MMSQFMDRLLTGKAISFTGREPKKGPQSVILVGVHGDEVCGVQAAESIFPGLSIGRGRVWVICGNPRAVRKNVRFVEANLNRMFKQVFGPEETGSRRTSYEYRRAQYLKPYLERADVLLDVHASSNPRSRRFVICEHCADSIARQLPVGLIVSGFDAIEPGGTDYYANLVGKIGICVECGCLRKPGATDVAKEAILAFLAVRGHISGNVKRRPQRRVNMDELHSARAKGCVLARKFRDFESITVGTLIARDGREEVRAPRDGIILFAKSTEEIGDEAFLLGEYV